jgi:hypothetical protein
MNKKSVVILSTTALFVMMLVHLLLIAIVAPNTYISGITHEQYKEIINTSSVAAADVKLKAGALVLYNGYEGSQFLLKYSLLFGIAASILCFFNLILIIFNKSNYDRPTKQPE